MNEWFKLDNKDGESILVECTKDAYGDVVIPNGITQIMDNAFENCPLITSITIPNSIQKIGKNAFTGCESLTRLVFPKAVVSRIGGRNFVGHIFYEVSK